MPTKFKLLMLLTLLWYGCTKEPDGPDGSEATRMLKIEFGSSTTTKGNIDSRHPGGKTAIHDAAIYFYRGTSKKLVMYYPLKASDIEAVNSGTGTIMIEVPATADNAFMVANYKISLGNNYPFSDSWSWPGESGIDAVSGSTITTANQMKQQPIAHSAENVVMSGLCQIALDPMDETKFQDASITISPLVARLEIGGLTAGNIDGSATPHQGDIMSYTVAGIYINGYYFKTNLLGQHKIGEYLNTIFPVDNGQNTEKYNSGYTGQIEELNTVYASTKMYIEPTAGTADSDGAKKVIAGLDKVWAFQLFENNPPHIIIKLTDIMYSDGAGGHTPNSVANPSGLPQYLTIQAYHLPPSAGGGLINTFERTKVYKLEDIPFTALDLGDTPYSKLQLFRVTVTVKAWSEASIETSYD